jgi:hypothetical protein
MSSSKHELMYKQKLGAPKIAEFLSPNLSRARISVWPKSSYLFCFLVTLKIAASRQTCQLAHVHFCLKNWASHRILLVLLLQWIPRRRSLRDRLGHDRWAPHHESRVEEGEVLACYRAVAMYLWVDVKGLQVCWSEITTFSSCVHILQNLNFASFDLN